MIASGVWSHSKEAIPVLLDLGCHALDIHQATFEICLNSFILEEDPQRILCNNVSSEPDLSEIIVIKEQRVGGGL